MPARLAIAAAFVVLQTGIAGWLGPQLSGLVTPFPIVVILLTAFAHHRSANTVRHVCCAASWSGCTRSRRSFSSSRFGIEPLAPWPAYLLGLGACLAINGLTLWALRRRL